MILAFAIPVGGALPNLVCLDERVDLSATLARASADTLLVIPAGQPGRAAVVAERVVASRHVAKAFVSGTATQQALVCKGLALLEAGAYGRAQAVADGLLRICHTRLALNSVAGLSLASPSMWQHLRSLLPGSSFEVDVTRGTVTGSPEIRWQVDRSHEAFWSQSDSLSPLKIEVRMEGGPIPVPAEAKPYGARRWAELTTIERLTQVVPRMLASIRPTFCSACGRTVAQSGCPFCGTSSPSTGRGDLSTLTLPMRNQSFERIAL